MTEVVSASLQDILPLLLPCVTPEPFVFYASAVPSSTLAGPQRSATLQPQMSACSVVLIRCISSSALGVTFGFSLFGQEYSTKQLTNLVNVCLGSHINKKARQKLLAAIDDIDRPKR